MSRNVRNNPKHARGDRSGMSVVEFALLLPFLAVLAASLFSLVHLSHRAMGQSYAAFAAARRCAVSGRDPAAAGLVRADYAAFLVLHNYAGCLLAPLGAGEWRTEMEKKKGKCVLQPLVPFLRTAL